MKDLIIIGGGPAGLTGAIYSARAGMKVIVIEKGAPGGKLLNSSVFDNYPGTKGISGGDLANSIYQQAKSFGAEFIFGNIESIVDKGPKLKEITVDGQLIQSKTLLIATGLEPRKLNVKNFDKFFGNGISTCVICDGALHKNKPMVIVGGGYSATEETGFASRLASQLYIVNNRSKLNGEKITLDSISKLKNVTIKNNYEVVEFIGEKDLEGIKIENLNTKEIETIKTNGVFIYIGADPQTKFLKNLGITNTEGYIKVNPLTMETSIPGIYSAGDVLEKSIRQLTNAVSEGTIAVLEIEKYINK